MPDRMPNRMSEDMSDRMPEDVPVRTCINVMVGITRSKVIFCFSACESLQNNKTKLKIVQDSLEGEQEFVIHSEPEDGSLPKQGSQEQAPKQG
jgi:hypothetical protein